MALLFGRGVCQGRLVQTGVFPVDCWIHFHSPLATISVAAISIAVVFVVVAIVVLFSSRCNGEDGLDEPEGHPTSPNKHQIRVDDHLDWPCGRGITHEEHE